MKLIIQKYRDADENRWDEFIEKNSLNGTFLQTRRFINYHAKDKFNDASLIILNGTQIVACILACEYFEDGKKIFYSHKGTSFGGIIISRQIYNTSCMTQLMDNFETYIEKMKYDECYLKMTPNIFAKDNMELIEYFLFQRNYKQYNELNYYLWLKKYQEDILKNFSTSKRRDYRYSLRAPLEFKELIQKEDISSFYSILVQNLRRHKVQCVHTLEDLLDTKFNRFNERVKFFGVYLEENIIAGSMIFIFNESVMHTQYLAADKEFLQVYPMDFLIYNLIVEAKEAHMKYLTFGICTEDKGRYLNMGLSHFKEGFGTDYCVNRTFYKKYL